MVVGTRMVHVFWNSFNLSFRPSAINALERTLPGAVGAFIRDNFFRATGRSGVAGSWVVDFLCKLNFSCQLASCEAWYF